MHRLILINDTPLVSGRRIRVSWHNPSTDPKHCTCSVLRRPKARNWASRKPHSGSFRGKRALATYPAVTRREQSLQAQNTRGATHPAKTHAAARSSPSLSPTRLGCPHHVARLVSTNGGAVRNRRATSITTSRPFEGTATTSGTIEPCVALSREQQGHQKRSRHM